MVTVEGVTLEPSSPGSERPSPSRSGQQRTSGKIASALLRTCQGTGGPGTSQGALTMPLRTLRGVQPSRLWNVVECLLKSKLLGHKKFSPLSSYLNVEEERCPLLLCLLVHFYEELCALNRCQPFFSSLQLAIFNYGLKSRFLQPCALGLSHMTIYGVVLFRIPST